MITSTELPTQDARSLAFLESVTTSTSLQGFDSGFLPWLGRFRRVQHAELTGSLPDRIQRAWALDDLSDFVDALADWEHAFAEAVKLYRHQKELANG